MQEIYSSVLQEPQGNFGPEIAPPQGIPQSADGYIKVGGDITPQREDALANIQNRYAHVFTQLGYLLKDNPYSKIQLDENMPADILGETARIDSSWDVYINAKLYDEAPKNLLDDYLQLQPLLHERVHESTLQGSDGKEQYDEAHEKYLDLNPAIETLQEMGYSKEKITGFAEIPAEKIAIDALALAGEVDLVNIAITNSPYGGSLKAGYKIANFFEYETEKKTYRGWEGFVEALKDKVLDYTTVNEYLRGAEVKLPSECGKCSKYVPLQGYC